MKRLPDAFFELASVRLAESALVPHSWSDPATDGRRVLEVPAVAETGFSVRVECENSGLYVYAGEWHGSPFECRPPTATPEETAANCLGFVRTLLCSDSTLEVSYAGTRPYRWVLKYATDGGPAQEEMGLLVYNYFAAKATRVLQNNHLPPRHGKRAA